MTTSTATAPAPLVALDARITRALLALRQARLAVAHSPNSGTMQLQTRAEEELNALLDYRSVVWRRASQSQP